MDDAVRRLGRFQIIGRLATGGMAEVYLALSGELPGFRTLIVVKRILPHLASNGQFIRMFLDEARLAALLDHPNVVRIIEVGHDGEEYFLAMELVQGKPLSAVLRKATRERRPPTPALAAYLIAQAASGLGYAHGLTDGDGQPLGVVHRDVSPQNILVSFEGAVKLIDFGVARAFGRVAHTSPGGLKGKIEYMSPEQASAEEVDHRADVFALGVVLWEVLTGRRLFRRETELATMRAIVDDPIPKPSEVAEVPPELEAVVMRALRKRRDARYGSAHEMALALERYAFANDGFSPQQVAGYMKGLFAPEFLQWRKTATAALDMEVEPTQGKSRIEPFGAEPVTQGPTMALRPGLSSSGVRPGTDVPAERTQSRASRSHGSRSQLSRSQTAPSAASAPTSPTSASAPSSPSSPSATSQVEPPSKRDRVWVYGGLAILGAITAAVAWMLARPPGPAVAESVRPPALAMPAASPVPAAAPDLASKPEAVKPEAVKTAAPAGAASGPTAVPAGPPAPTPAPATTAVPALATPVAQSPETPPAAAQPTKAASHPRPRRRIHARHDEASAAAPASGGTASDGKASDGKASDGKADPFE